MKNKQLLHVVLLGCTVLHLSSAKAACDIAQYTTGADTLDVNALGTSTSTTICGQTVTLTSLNSGISIAAVDQVPAGSGNLGFGGASASLYNGQTIQLNSPIQISVNGQVVFSGSFLTRANFMQFWQTLGLSVAQPLIAATSLASTSASSKVSDTIFHNIISPSIQTRSQQQKQQDRPMQKLIIGMADLKYEHAEFTDTKDRGNIGGFSASGSYEINKSFSVGAIIPYDHMAFNSFDADRTGTILYVKNTLKLPSNFELSTAVNGNYMYTATQFNGISGTNQLHTYGGGVSTRLKFDHLDSNFIPSAAFSYQYNKDSTNIQDNQQHLLKVGPALGYRVLDNATVQVSGSWTKDISQYQTLKNGNDYYDVGLEGAWVISDVWQLRGGYKKILGLTNFESDSIYLGSALKF